MTNCGAPGRHCSGKHANSIHELMHAFGCNGLAYLLADDETTNTYLPALKAERNGADN